MGYEGTQNPLDPEDFMDVDENSLNFYKFQTPLDGDPYANPYFVYDNSNIISSFVHELGHSLSLVHTFETKFHFDGTTTFLHEPKNHNKVDGNNVPLCQNTGDRICDTGLDPYLKSYVANCTLKPGCSAYNNYYSNCPDGYNDSSTEWDIPYDNYMSYYYNCHSRFTACQIAKMHEALEGEYQNIYPNYLLDCSQDPYANLNQNCDDITIDQEEEWTDEVVKLCAGKKINILDGASLKLVRTKITTDAANSACPGLSGKWDGIYITGDGLSPSSLQSGGDYLLITDNSVVEYSLNGIQALNGTNGILIDHSNFINNGVVMNVKDKSSTSSTPPYYTSYPDGKIIIKQSTINVENENSNTQITIRGADLDMGQSNITIASGIDKFGTGIKHLNGKLDVNDSKFRNFDVAIDKESDGILGGLILKNNKIYNSQIAVRNNTNKTTALHNYLEGAVQSLSLCYGTWDNNTFTGYLKGLAMNNPSESMNLINNLFDKNKTIFSGSHKNTNVLCNLWDDTNDAIRALFTNPVKELKPNWGNQLQSSGNKWENGNMPRMVIVITQGGPTRNYQPDETQQRFDYVLGVQEARGNENETCTNDYPTALSNPNENESQFVNKEYRDSIWTVNDSLYDYLQNQLLYADSAQSVLIKERMSDTKVKMGQAVLFSLIDTAHITDTTFVTEWESKANPKLVNQLVLLELLYQDNYDGMITYLNNLNPSDTLDILDKDNLLDCLDWVKDFVDENYLLTNLNAEDIKELEEYARLSFGDYTSIIRAFLNLEYGIRISPFEDELEQYVNKFKETNKEEIQEEILIYPNPVQNCLHIESQIRGINFRVKIIDINGFEIVNTEIKDNEQFCLDDVLPPSLYVLKVSDTVGHELIQKKLIIK